MKLLFTVMMIMIVSSVHSAEAESSKKNIVGTYTVANDPACQALVDNAGFAAVFTLSAKTDNCKVSVVPTACDKISDQSDKAPATANDPAVQGAKTKRE